MSSETRAELRSYPIVGAFHRAQDTRDPCPAAAILKILPIETKLLLRPEPDNRVDPNAIAVWLDEDDFPDLSEAALQKFAKELTNSGWNLEGVYVLSEYKLGYLPASVAVQIKLTGETPGELTFDLSGKPKVKFTTGV